MKAILIFLVPFFAYAQDSAGFEDGNSLQLAMSTTTTTVGKGVIGVGDKAPDFTLKSQKDTSVKLSEVFAKKYVVLYFYPKDGTSVCTAESCSFRDAYEAFKDEGAEVIGVSGDSVASHKKFAKENNLPFLLLSDVGNKVRSAYRIPSTMGVIPGRVTFLIDKKGVVRHSFSSQFDGKKHVDEMLKTLKDLNSHH